MRVVLEGVGQRVIFLFSSRRESRGQNVAFGDECLRDESDIEAHRLQRLDERTVGGRQ